MTDTRKSLSKLLRGKDLQSEDWHQIGTPGTQYDKKDPKLSKVRQAPDLDDETRRINALKEEQKRAALGRRATVLKENTTLG